MTIKSKSDSSGNSRGEQDYQVASLSIFTLQEVLSAGYHYQKSGEFVEQCYFM
ncbi:hypothetical protein ACFLT8_02200 [Chloroflexota bacterium]